MAQPLFWNSKIQIDQKSIFFKKWNQKGIRFINDLVDQDGRILSPNEYEKKFSISLDFLQYSSVCQVGYPFRESVIEGRYIAILCSTKNSFTLALKHESF